MTKTHTGNFTRAAAWLLLCAMVLGLFPALPIAAAYEGITTTAETFSYYKPTSLAYPILNTRMISSDWFLKTYLTGITGEKAWEDSGTQSIFALNRDMGKFRVSHDQKGKKDTETFYSETNFVGDNLVIKKDEDIKMYFDHSYAFPADVQAYFQANMGSMRFGMYPLTIWNSSFDPGILYNTRYGSMQVGWRLKHGTTIDAEQMYDSSGSKYDEKILRFGQDNGTGVVTKPIIVRENGVTLTSYARPAFLPFASSATTLDFYGTTITRVSHETPTWCNVPGMYLADTMQPKVTKVFAAFNNAGAYTPKLTFGKDEYMYIVLEFNEPIRLYDDMESSMNGLELAFVLGTSTTTRKAALCDVGGDNGRQLVFRYLVPDGLVNARFAAVDSYSEQNWATVSQRSSFAIPYKTGSVSVFRDTGLADSDPQYAALFQMSAIVDYAGNAVDLQNSNAMVSGTVVCDTQELKVTSVEVTTEPRKQDGDVYIRDGDVLRFRLNLSRSVTVTRRDDASTRCVTNLLDGSNNPVVLRLDTKEGAQQDYLEFVVVEGTPGTGAHAWPKVPIRSGHHTVTEGVPIAITEFWVGGSTFEDDLGHGLPTAHAITALGSLKNQYLLDRVAPTVAPAEADGGGGYPVHVTNSAETEFYLPLIFSDTGSGFVTPRGDRAAGSATLLATVNGVENTVLKTSVALSSSIVPPGYLQGSAFGLLNGTQNLHFRLDEWRGKVIDDLRLELEISDAAGNKSTASFPLQYTSDFVDSTVALREVAATANGDDFLDLVFTFAIDDPSGIQAVEVSCVGANDETRAVVADPSVNKTVTWVPGSATSATCAITITGVPRAQDGAFYWFNFPMEITDGGGRVTGITENRAQYTVRTTPMVPYTVSEGQMDVRADHSLTLDLSEYDKINNTVYLRITENPGAPGERKTDLMHIGSYAGETLDVLDAAQMSALFGGADIIDMLKTLYGEVQVEIICKYLNLEVNAVSRLEVFQFCRGSDGMPSHTVSLAAFLPNGDAEDISTGKLALTMNPNYQTPEDGVMLPRDLSQSTLRLTIGANQRIASYGLDDIDFAQTSVTISDGEGFTEALPLTENGVNSFTMPAGLQSGVAYTATANVVTKGGQTYCDTYGPICFFDATADTFGVTKVAASFELEWFYDIEKIALRAGEPTKALFLPGEVRDTTFHVELPPAPAGAEGVPIAFLKLWNPAAGQTKETAAWRPMDNTTGDVTLRFGEGDLPIVMNGVSTYSYCIRLINGFETQEAIQDSVDPTGVVMRDIELRVEASDSMPGIAFDNKNFDLTMTQAVIFNASPQSKTCSSDELEIYCLDSEDGTGRAFRWIKDDTDTYTYTYSHSVRRDNASGSITPMGMVFYVMDKYHNVDQCFIQVTNVDNDKPGIYRPTMSADEAEMGAADYHVNIMAAYDKLSLAKDLDVVVTVDEVLSAALGIAPGQPIFTGYRDFMNDNTGQRRLNYSDIYTFDRFIVLKPYANLYPIEEFVDIYDVAMMTIDGKLPYIPGAGETCTFTFYVSVMDEAGNTQEFEQEITVPNQEPGLVRVDYFEKPGELPDVFLVFNKPVVLTSRKESPYAYSDGELQREVNTGFCKMKYCDWVYQDGTYEVSYRDAFGNEYTTEFVVDCFGDYGIEVSFSPARPTKEDVEVRLDARGNDKAYLDMTGLTLPGPMTDSAVDGQGRYTYVTVTVSEAVPVPYKVALYAGGETLAYRTQAPDIQKTPPAVEVIYTPSKPVTDGKTWGYVRAALRGVDRPVYADDGVNVFDFALGGETSHAFRYSDEYGHTGQITATNPYTMIAQPEETIDGDAAAPGYRYTVWVQNSAAVTYYGSFGDYTHASAEMPPFLTALTLIFEADSVNHVTYSLKEGTVAGVSLSHNLIRVTENAQFTVVLTDTAGKKTEVPFRVNGKFGAKIAGEVIFVYSTRSNTYRAYLNVDLPMNLGREVRVVQSGGLPLYDSGLAMYYYEFSANGIQTFTVEDKYGFTDYIEAVCAAFDTSAPAARATVVTPYVVNKATQERELSTAPTSGDVVFTLSFFRAGAPGAPMNLKSVELLDLNNGSAPVPDAVARVTLYGADATVTVKQNARIRVRFTAANNQTGTFDLQTVDFIDKAAPVVSQQSAVPNYAEKPTAILYTLTTDEDAFFNRDAMGQTATSRKTHTFTATANGDYLLSFADLAGNQSILVLNVTGIDKTPPALTLTLPDMTGYAQSFTVKASMNYSGTLSFLGADYAVGKDAEEIFEITANGVYKMIATDAAGLQTSRLFSVSMIDRTPPTVNVPVTKLYVKQGTSAADFRALALAELQCFDSTSGVDLADAAAVVLSTVNLDAVGDSTLQYTVRDRAGNETTATRPVLVYDDSSIILAKVNGVTVLPGSAISLTIQGGSGYVTVSDVSITGQPYKMYYAVGEKTAAQMKTAGTLFDGSFLVPATRRFYTLYILGQDRQELIVYLYIDTI